MSKDEINETSEDVIVVEQYEHDVSTVFSGLSMDRGGNWNGETLSFSDSLGEYDIVSLAYPNGVIVGVTSLLFHKSHLVRNLRTSVERHIAIRIGYSGDITNKDGIPSNSEGIYIYDASQPFDMYYPKGRLSQWMVIRFPFEYFKTWNKEASSHLMNILFNEEKYFFYYRLNPEIETVVREVYRASKDERTRRFIFYSRAFEIIGRINLLLEENQDNYTHGKVHSKDLETMMQVKEELLDDFSSAPNLSVLSANYNMSVSKLQRIFKQVYNLPILKFFNQHRLEEAHRLIKYSDRSINDISLSLDFYSPSHFSRAFKKQFGYNPNEVRGK